MAWRLFKRNTVFLMDEADGSDHSMKLVRRSCSEIYQRNIAMCQDNQFIHQCYMIALEN